MNKERSILLYGPPASGKSTVAKEVSDQTGISYLSVGDMTREEISSKSKRGLRLQKYLDEVVEYPVELISEVVEERIVKAIQSETSFILDGFPKYPGEATAFVSLMEKHKFKIDAIAIIEIPFQEALIRAASRRICTECLLQTTIDDQNICTCDSCGGSLIIRDDDRPEVLERRYQDYDNSIRETLAILEGHYTKLLTIDGTNNRETVEAEFARVAQQ